MSNLEDETFKIIGKNIKKFRKEANLTQEKMAELLQFNEKYIGHVERLERYISLRKLIKIAELLNKSIIEFFK